MPQRYFLTLARYNAWANQRLYDAVARLPEAEYLQPRPSFFGSIHATLNHILVGDRLWIARIEGKPAPRLRLDQILYPELVGLRVAREAEDQHIINVVGNLDAAQLAATLTYTNTKGNRFNDPMRLVLGHFFNHQTHHRGQAHGLLSQTSVAPPSLDLIEYMRAQPAP